METRSIEEIRRLAWSGRKDEAREALGELLCTEARLPHAEAAEIAEQLGLPAAAVREWEAAIEASPCDPAPMRRLAALLEEEGDWERAVELLERAVSLGDPDPSSIRSVVAILRREGLAERAASAIGIAAKSGIPQEIVAQLEKSLKTQDEDDFSHPGEEQGEIQAHKAPEPPSDDEVFRFLHAFSGREGIYARQWWDQAKAEGGYSPVHEPLTFKPARDHLVGATTLGVYVVRLDNTVSFMAFDVDMAKAAMERVKGDPAKARALREAVVRVSDGLRDFLSQLGMEPIIEESGYKGRHLWVLLEKPVDGSIAFQFGQTALQAFPGRDPGIGIEFFPKQARTGPGIGNLIKLPLGMHRRTGRWSRILGPDGLPAGDPHGIIRSAARLGSEALCAAVMDLRRRAAAPASAGTAITNDAAEPEEADRQVGRMPLPVPAPAWTEADFETDREISHLLKSCPVLSAVKEKAIESRVLTYDERVVLRHTLGHLQRGVPAVNWLFERCPGVRTEEFLKSQLSGNPVSCPRMRQRIPGTAANSCGDCLFTDGTDTYPHPLRHLASLPPECAAVPAAPARGESIETLCRRLGSLMERARDVEKEIAGLRVSALEAMRAAGVDRVTFPEGEFVLSQAEGEVPSLAWKPSAIQLPMGGAEKKAAGA